MTLTGTKWSYYSLTCRWWHPCSGCPASTIDWVNLWVKVCSKQLWEYRPILPRCVTNILYQLLWRSIFISIRHIYRAPCAITMIQFMVAGASSVVTEGSSYSVSYGSNTRKSRYLPNPKLMHISPSPGCRLSLPGLSIFRSSTSGFSWAERVALLFFGLSAKLAVPVIQRTAFRSCESKDARICTTSLRRRKSFE